ncbi:MAG: HEPN domain-containing protein [Deltaproteobacteria bacterium]|uniref:HEPN domain-containing protein n=1 Tax=Candidatus Desulfacyla euxinica TaxID=2841693 RepID=A0A8J6N2Q2_9DELT|nr:HEPN domain-containing protein [Candidatus Desulfacyla euxinica]MBL7217447.1 HEPN domain-containing protein [Desulfobacteraceae bacterium]
MLIDGKLFRESVPKLYYTMFHILRALLFTKGLEPRSHGGVSRMQKNRTLGVVRRSLTTDP